MQKGERIGFGLRKRWKGQCMALDYVLLCRREEGWERGENGDDGKEKSFGSLYNEGSATFEGSCFYLAIVIVIYLRIVFPFTPSLPNFFPRGGVRTVDISSIYRFISSAGV